MMKKYFVHHEEVIDVFHENIIFPEYKNFHFMLLLSGFLVQWVVGRLEMIVSALMHKNYIKF